MTATAVHQSVVINREFGSGGREIGRLISQQLGADFFDSRILQDAAASKGLPANQLAAFDERLVAGAYLNLGITGFSDPELTTLPYRMFSAFAEVTPEAAKRAPAVFIGRCADVILHEAGLPVRSVFVYSTDAAAKVARAVQVDHVPPKEAERHIARMDKARSRYQAFFTGTRFGETHEYDLCLNSGQISPQACAAAVIATLT